VHVDDLNSFEFDVLTLDADDLFPCVLYMFERHSLLREFKIENSTFDLFIQTIRAGYKTEPQYHGWHHGCDVLHNVYRIYDTTSAIEYMSKLEFLASFVAAIAHDLGHLGVNNTFLVKSKHALALLHNDVSPLENMHASKLYDILRDPACNIMKNLDDAQWQSARKQILSSILNTDMAFHFDNLKKLEMFEEVNGVFVIEFLETREFRKVALPPCLKESHNRLLLQESILHAADLGNPLKPFAIYSKWVGKVTDEFFAQGDKEKELGMPVSPMCERSTTNIANMQLGFMDFIVAPWYLAMFKIFPSGLLPLAENIQHNYIHWAKMRKHEFPSEADTLREKVAKFTGKFQEIGLEIHVPSDCFAEPVVRKIQARNSLAKHRSKKMDDEDGGRIGSAI
jgi:cAMP-specific phosphodiesterase 4